MTQRIFEPFFTTRRFAGGTGLGLSVAHGFCKQAGGALVLEPSLQGATFALQVPLAVGGHRAEDGRSEAYAAMLGPQVLSGTFLVVEDDEHVAATLLTWLEALGADADWVSTVADGVERVVDPAQTYRCVISDIVLPDGEGFSVIEALRDRRPQAAAIYMSGFSRILPSALDDTLCCPFVAKPFSSAELLQALAGLGVVEAPLAHNAAHAAPDTAAQTRAKAAAHASHFSPSS